MSAVKIVSGPEIAAPEPTNKAVIQGQGSIPYAKTVEEKTPNIGKATVVKGKKRGMGAALRGGSFKNC
jgi:hypothetical protein